MDLLPQSQRFVLFVFQTLSGSRSLRPRLIVLIQAVHFAQPRVRQPLLLRRHPPSDDCEKGDGAKYDGRVVEPGSRDGEVEGREQHGSEEHVPDERDEVQRSRPLSERPGGVLELMRRDEAAAESNQGVGSNGRDAGGGDQRRECHGGGQDCAQEQGAEDVHDDDGVARLLFLGHLRDPAGEGQDAVAGDGPDES